MKRFSQGFKRATLLTALVAALLLVVTALAGAASAPQLLTETNCVGSAAGCSAGFVLDNPQGVALTSDGSRVLVASEGSDALAVFLRGRNGQLTQSQGDEHKKACVSQTGDAGTCQDGHGLLGPTDVLTVSNNVYVASNGSNAIDMLLKDKDSKQFAQDPGAKGCINEDGSDGCADGHGLTGALSLAINPSGGGNFVYVGGDHTIAAFKRSTSSGELTQLPAGNPNFPSTAGCVNDDGTDGCEDQFVPGDVVGMAFSSDGKYLYAAVSGSPGAVLVFNRLPQGPLVYQGCFSDGGTGGCTPGTDLDNPTGIGLDRSGKNVYVASRGSGAVTIFSRDQRTGAIAQLGGTQFVANLNRVAVASNNKGAYATTDTGIISYVRDKKHGGALTQADCMTNTGGCTAPAGNGLAGAQAVFPSSSGKDVYVVGATDDSVVALKHT
ncbi:MAG TPA: beta-propeller fold lactonase family protein [Gaiellaceae bacterium]|nr:beta-propeller fold lactonase family protein [Gaiellaceae bacterium]